MKPARESKIILLSKTKLPLKATISNDSEIEDRKAFDPIYTVVAKEFTDFRSVCLWRDVLSKGVLMFLKNVRKLKERITIRALRFDRGLIHKSL